MRTSIVKFLIILGVSLSFACTRTQQNQGVIKVDIPESDTMLNADTLMVDTAANSKGPAASTSDTSATAVTVPIP